MAAYRERAPRIQASFPVVFQIDDVEIAGICLNISKSGLLGNFAHSLDLWTEGELSLDFTQGIVGIKARVARSMGSEAALVFLFRGDADHRVVDIAVELAQGEMKAQGLNLATPF